MSREEEVGLHYAFGFTHWALKIIGLWPINDQFSNLKMIVTVVSLISSLIPSVSLIMAGTDFPSTLDQIFLCLPLITAMLNVITMKVTNGVLVDVFRIMCEDWDRYALLRQDAKTMMVISARSGRKMNFFCVLTTFLSIIAYLTEPIRSAETIDVSSNETVRKLPSKGFYLFDITKSPTYEIMYVVQTFTSCLYGTMISALNCLLIVTVCHARGKLGVIGVTLKRYAGIAAHERIRDVVEWNCPCMRCIVQSHARTLTFMDNLKMLFWKYMLLQQLETILILAVEGYKLITFGKENDAFGVLIYVTYAVAASYGLFTCCYVGQYIIDQSESLARIAYELEWSALPRKSTLPLILLTVRSQKPCELTTKFAVMSLSYYKKVLATSVSYVSVLIAIK